MHSKEKQIMGKSSMVEVFGMLMCTYALLGVFCFTQAIAFSTLESSIRGRSPLKTGLTTKRGFY
jgi:hypothetical protein